MIDVNNPIATPFRTQYSDDPRVDYQFNTGIITSASGREQRHPLNQYPKMRITWKAQAMSHQHVSRIEAMSGLIMNSAIAVRDYHMNASGRVSLDGMSVVLSDWGSSWAAGIRLVIEDRHGMHEHTAKIVSVDPSSRTLTLDRPAPAGLMGSFVKLGSAVVASLDGSQTMDKQTDAVASWDLTARSFNGLDQIGGAHGDLFPLKHGVSDGVRITSGRNVKSVDFGIGRRHETLGYDSWISGFRSFQVEAVQMTQDDKERLISFFCGCRGQLKAFFAPGLVEGARFRFGSDILSVVHTAGDMSKASMNVTQVIQ